jgi:hypothetical protein
MRCVRHRRKLQRLGKLQQQRDKAGTADGELRMWLFIRKDLPMPPGKLAAQAGARLRPVPVVV